MASSSRQSPSTDRKETPSALHRGNQALAAGQWAEAERHLRRHVRSHPRHAGAWLNLACALQEQNQLAAALNALNTALACQPGFVEALANRGLLRQRLGQGELALADHQAALAGRPADPRLLFNLGTTCQQLGQGEKAAAVYGACLQQAPTLAMAWTNLGVVLENLGALAEAGRCHEAALILEPDWSEAWLNAGAAHLAGGDLAAAEQALWRAAQTGATQTVLGLALTNLGTALRLQGRYPEALAVLESALATDTVAHIDYLLAGILQCRRYLAAWDGLEALSARLVALIRDREETRVPPFILLACPEATAADQLRVARQAAARSLRRCDGAGPAFRVRPVARPFLTIGYLSGDFQEHATTVLIRDLLGCHARPAFRIVGCSYGPDDGGSRRRQVRAACDVFLDLETDSHAQAAQRIAAQEVDILVDLKGHTHGARPEIVLRRPAPVQVAWLGYPGATGLPALDYAVVDATIAPPEVQPFFSERLVWLPETYQVNDRERDIAAVPLSRAAMGLPEQGMVYVCFNALYKLTPTVFRNWMEILRAVPDSVLWLLDGGPVAQANLRRAAQAQGVATSRLVFAPRQPPELYLAQYRLADLFLDTLPVNAHTTASDALWAGCPLLTQMGETLAGRVGASLVRAVGLPELVVASADDYIGLAIRLGRDPAALAVYKARLATDGTKAPLFDTPRFVRHLEAAFRQMWSRHQAGLPPESFAVPALPTLH